MIQNPTKDTHLRQAATTTVHGSAVSIICGWPDGGLATRALLSFDDAAWPSMVTAASLVLTCTDAAVPPAGLPFTLYVLKAGNQDWVETEATWNVQASGTPWVGSVGLGSGGVDYYWAPDPVVTVNLPTIAVGATWTIDVLALVNHYKARKVPDGLSKFNLFMRREAESVTSGQAVFGSLQGLDPPTLEIPGLQLPPGHGLDEWV